MGLEGREIKGFVCRVCAAATETVIMLENMFALESQFPRGPVIIVTPRLRCAELLLVKTDDGHLLPTEIFLYWSYYMYLWTGCFGAFWCFDSCCFAANDWTANLFIQEWTELTSLLQWCPHFHNVWCSENIFHQCSAFSQMTMPAVGVSLNASLRTVLEMVAVHLLLLNCFILREESPSNVRPINHRGGRRRSSYTLFCCDLIFAVVWLVDGHRVLSAGTKFGNTNGCK